MEEKYKSNNIPLAGEFIWRGVNELPNESRATSLEGGARAYFEDYLFHNDLTLNGNENNEIQQNFWIAAATMGVAGYLKSHPEENVNIDEETLIPVITAIAAKPEFREKLASYVTPSDPNNSMPFSAISPDNRQEFLSNGPSTAMEQSGSTELLEQSLRGNQASISHEINLWDSMDTAVRSWEKLEGLSSDAAKYMIEEQPNKGRPSLDSNMGSADTENFLKAAAAFGVANYFQNHPDLNPQLDKDYLNPVIKAVASSPSFQKQILGFFPENSTNITSQEMYKFVNDGVILRAMDKSGVIAPMKEAIADQNSVLKNISNDYKEVSNFVFNQTYEKKLSEQAELLKKQIAQEPSNTDVLRKKQEELDQQIQYNMTMQRELYGCYIGMWPGTYTPSLLSLVKDMDHRLNNMAELLKEDGYVNYGGVNSDPVKNGFILNSMVRYTQVQAILQGKADSSDKSVKAMVNPTNQQILRDTIKRHFGSNLTVASALRYMQSPDIQKSVIGQINWDSLKMENTASIMGESENQPPMQIQEQPQNSSIPSVQEANSQFQSVASHSDTSLNLEEEKVNNSPRISEEEVSTERPSYMDAVRTAAAQNPAPALNEHDMALKKILDSQFNAVGRPVENFVDDVSKLNNQIFDLEDKMDKIPTGQEKEAKQAELAEMKKQFKSLFEFDRSIDAIRDVHCKEASGDSQALKLLRKDVSNRLNIMKDLLVDGNRMHGKGAEFIKTTLARFTQLQIASQPGVQVTGPKIEALLKPENQQLLEKMVEDRMGKNITAQNAVESFLKKPAAQKDVLEKMVHHFSAPAPKNKVPEVTKQVQNEFKVL